MSKFFPMYFGSMCNYDADISYSNVGTVTLTCEGPYLYVMDEGLANPSHGAGTLLIYDMSNPFSPILLSTTSTPDGTRPSKPFVTTGGTRLYVAYQGNAAVASTRGFAVWDVSNKSAPTQMGAYYYSDAEMGSGGTRGVPSSCAVIGSVAAVAVGGGFVKPADAMKHDVSDPTNPTLVDTVLWGPSSTVDVLPSGANFVFSGIRSSGGQGFIQTVDAANFNSLDFALDGQTFAGGACLSVTEDGAYGFITNFVADCTAYDISDPSNITLLDQITLTTGAGACCSVLIDEFDRLYVGATGLSNIKIVDISDPSNISETGTLTTGGERVTDMERITDSCFGFAWAAGTTGVVVNLLGTPPLA